MKLFKFAVAVTALSAGFAHGAAIYSNLPSAIPPNVASLGYQATSTTEFGDHIAFGAGGRNLTTVSVLMSNWALESTYGLGGSGYQHELTFNIYQYGSSSGPGAVVASKTIDSLIPWRPEADPTCVGGTAWRASDGQCYNGLAFTVVFDFSADGVVLPDEVVFGLSFNTQSHGNAPLGTEGPYNSLNFGLVGGAPSVGTDVNADSVFWNTSHAPFLTPGGPGIAGQFSEDSNWTGYAPAVQFNVAEVPEPASLALAGLALAGLAASRRRKT